MADKNILQAPISICIENAAEMADISKYAQWSKEDSFPVVWLDLPTTQEKLAAALGTIGIASTNDKRCFVADFKSDIAGLCDRLDSGANIDELNMLAAKLAVMTQPELEIFSAVMLAGKHCGSLMEIINVTENLSMFALQPAFSHQQYGEFLAEMSSNEYDWAVEKLYDLGDTGMRDFAAYVQRLEKYFNATAYARDIVKMEGGMFTDLGYLTESEDFKHVHDVVPGQYRVVTPAVPTPEQRPSALGRLAAAKEEVARNDAAQSLRDKLGISHNDAEL